MRDMFALAPAEDWRDVRVELPKGTEDIKQVCHPHKATPPPWEVQHHYPRCDKDWAPPRHRGILYRSGLKTLCVV